MVFTELILDESQNIIIAAQEYSIDRKENHDWGLETGQILVRFEGKLPLISGIFEPRRYLWNPNTKQLEFITASKSGEDMATDSLTSKQTSYDNTLTQINSATDINDLKSIMRDLLGERPKLEESS